MKDFKIAICLLTCELDHLEEWLNHHKNYGFENYLVFLDSKYVKSLDDINPNLRSQINCIKILSTEARCIPRLYTKVCQKFKDHFDYIFFIDSDEYYESKTKNVIEDVNRIKEQYGDFDCLSIYWRMYGSSPQFETRVPIESYKQFRFDSHVKSLVNPKALENYLNAHVPKLKEGAIHIDAYGSKFKHYVKPDGTIIHGVGTRPNGEGKLGAGSPSQEGIELEKIWIKHIFTRSKKEWEDKLNRKGWYQETHSRTMKDYDSTNKVV